MKNFLKKFALVSAGLLLATTATGIYFKGLDWTTGLVVGFAWMFVNLFFLQLLLETAFFTKDEKKSKKIATILFFKFPVLYLIGFYILYTRTFSSLSVLLGVSTEMAAFVFAWISEGGLTLPME